MLKHNNPFYSDIEIDVEAVSELPINGTPDGITTVEGTAQQDSPNEGPAPETVHTISSCNASTSFLPQTQHIQTETDATINGTEWPPNRNCSMNFVRTHAHCAQTRAITARLLRAFSRNRAKLRQFAREIQRGLQSHFSAGMAKSICTFGKKGSRC